MNESTPERPEDPSLLTLEPLLELVRGAIEGEGWTTSGVQKTTSHEYEGRWEGESTRSAYLFFHREGAPESVAVESFLDETPRGLSANFSLVLDGRRLREVGAPDVLLQRLAAAASEHLPADYRRPVTLRYRLGSPGDPVSGARLQARLKIHLGRAAIQAGGAVVQSLVRTFIGGFDRLIDHPGVRSFLASD